MASGRVYDHARGLVDHDQILVLVGDRERGVGRVIHVIGSRARIDLDLLSGRDDVPLGPDRAVDRAHFPAAQGS